MDSCHGKQIKLLWKQQSLQLTLMSAFTLAVVFKAIDLSLFCREKDRSINVGMQFTGTD